MIKTRLYKNTKAHTFSRARGAIALGLHVLTLMASLLWLTAIPVASSANTPAASPELVIDSTRRDFGEVFIGEELSHAFTVRNIGTTPLELTNKSLTGQSSTPAHVLARSQWTNTAITNYLKPAAAIKRLAAPT